MLLIKSVFSKNKLTLNLFRNNIIIGCINTHIENIPIVNEHFIDDKFKNLLPPLTLLSSEKQKELLTKLEVLKFISNEEIAA